jgi:hypothetical protein
MCCCLHLSLNSKYTPQFRVLRIVQAKGENNQNFLRLFRKTAKAVKFRSLVLQLLYFRFYLINKYIYLYSLANIFID